MLPVQKSKHLFWLLISVSLAHWKILKKCEFEELIDYFIRIPTYIFLADDLLNGFWSLEFRSAIIKTLLTGWLGIAM